MRVTLGYLPRLRPIQRFAMTDEELARDFAYDPLPETSTASPSIARPIRFVNETPELPTVVVINDTPMIVTPPSAEDLATPEWVSPTMTPVSETSFVPALTESGATVFAPTSTVSTISTPVVPMPDSGAALPNIWGVRHEDYARSLAPVIGGGDPADEPLSFDPAALATQETAGRPNWLWGLAALALFLR